MPTAQRKRRHRRRLNDERLPAGPLQEWIREEAAEFENGIAGLAEHLGVNVEKLREVRYHRTTVAVYYADALLTDGGSHLRDVYPEWFEREGDDDV